MPVTSVLTVDGRRVTATWLPAPFVPPASLLTRVHAVCTGADGRKVLVSAGAVLEAALAAERGRG